MARPAPYRAAAPTAPPAPITASRVARRRNAAETTAPRLCPPAGRASWSAMAGYPVDEMAADQQPGDHGDERARCDPAQDQPGDVPEQPGKNKGRGHKVDRQHPDCRGAGRPPPGPRPAGQQRVEAGGILAESLLDLAELAPLPGMQPHRPRRQNFYAVARPVRSGESGEGQLAPQECD